MFAAIDELMDEDTVRFDLISMMHVLEHLNDPLETLVKLRNNLLTSDGYILIEVPNFYAHDSYEIAHLTCFTKHSLIQTLRLAGYDIVAGKEHGFPRSKVLNLYLTILATPKRNERKGYSLKPDRMVRSKRRLGFLYRKIMQKLFPRHAWLPTDSEGLV